MVFILLGLLFSIVGKYTVPAMVYTAWSYIAAGLLFFYLRGFELPNLDLYFLAYHGLTFLVMGYFLLRKEKDDA